MFNINFYKNCDFASYDKMGYNKTFSAYPETLQITTVTNDQTSITIVMSSDFSCYQFATNKETSEINESFIPYVKTLIPEEDIINKKKLKKDSKQRGELIKI